MGVCGEEEGEACAGGYESAGWGQSDMRKTFNKGEVRTLFRVRTSRSERLSPQH